MTYVKTHWINNEEPSIDADNLNHMEQGIEDAQYPDGGNAGQLLAKTTNGTEWVDAPNSAVWGLIQGQLNEQEDLYAELESKIVAPAGGTTGQYLRKTAGGTEWADAGSIDTVNNISPDANKNVQTVVELTQAQYNALANPDPNVTYLITDGINNPANNTINSRGVSYDNTDSGLTATTVQGAIDENATAIESLINGLMYESTTTTDDYGTVYKCKKYNNGDIEISDVVDIVFHGSSEGPYNGMYRSRETRSFQTLTRIDFAFAQGINSNVFISSTQPTSGNNTILYVAQSINTIATGLTISSTSVLIRGRWK